MNQRFLNHLNAIAFLLLSIVMIAGCSNRQDVHFTKLSSSRTGIDFKNRIVESEEFNVLNYGYIYNGGGVAVGDLNNDSLPDIYFTGNMVANKLYLNRGDFEFEDITKKAGLSASGLWNTGVTLVDINEDGWLDIYLCRSAAAIPERRKNLLFINNQDLTFTESAAAYGLDDPGYSTHAAFFDYDKDGDLDVFILNHSKQQYAGLNRFSRQYKFKKEPFIGDRLLQNQHGTFVDVSSISGIRQNVLGFGLGVAVSDLNGDQWPDLYVSNDYNEEDYLYINNQDGTFTESIKDYTTHTSLFSMGCDIADINNDLRPDIVTLDMLPESGYRQKISLGPENYNKYDLLIQSGFHHQTMRNMLQLNRGDGKFSEVGQLSGISNTDWSWAPMIADFDNDGLNDLFITNGYLRNYLDMDFMNYAVDFKLKMDEGADQVKVQDLIAAMPPIEESNYMYQNTDGLQFKDQSVAWGFEDKSISNGGAYADLDGDGDLDLVVSNLNEVAWIYRNNTEKKTNNHFLKINLNGAESNAFGIGSTVTLFTKDQKQQRELYTSRGFQSSVSTTLLFGLGAATMVDSLVVIWPDGKQQTLKNLSANQTLTLQYDQASDGGKPHIDGAKSDDMHFVASDAVVVPGFKHQENNFLDFKRDKLLPQGISRLGPKISKGDVNGDGLEDFYIGGAKGQAGALMINNDHGFEQKMQVDFSMDRAYEDTDAVFFDYDRDGDLDLYVVSGGSDFEENDAYLKDRIYRNDGRGNFTRDEVSSAGLPAVSASTVSATDFDLDGDTDLFIGGRLIPGKYPLSPRSFLFRNDQGVFTDVTAAMAPALQNPGMVTCSSFTDLNGDQFPDLIVAGEWMPIKVYFNQEGKQLKEQTAGLAQTCGWWNTLKVTDIDQDGDMDLLLGNFGLNSAFNASPENPIRLLYKDFDANGIIDPLMFYSIKGRNEFAFSRDELVGQVSFWKRKFPDYQSFASAEEGSFFDAEELEGIDTLQVNMLQSVWLMNDGKGNLIPQSLPEQAQFSPIYAFAVLENIESFDAIIGYAGNQSLTRISTGKFEANPGLSFLSPKDNSKNLLDHEDFYLSIGGDIRDIACIRSGKRLFMIIAINNKEIRILELL